MNKRNKPWLRAALPAVALATALTACGSDGSGDDDETTENAAATAEEEQQQQQQDPEAEADPTDEATDEASASESEPEPSPDDETPSDQAPDPGPDVEADYTLGETSDPILYGFAHGGVANFAVTVESFTVGTPDGQTKPVAVDLTIELTEGEDVTDADLGSLLSVAYTGPDGPDTAPAEDLDFDSGNACPADTTEPDTISMGEAFDTCRIALIPADAEPTTTAWGQEDTAATWSLTE